MVNVKIQNSIETGNLRIARHRKVALMKLQKDGSSKYKYFCGGVLVDDETVVTGENKN